MSWEALRLTSRTPAELHRVLGPHGVDDLIRHAFADCWREYPQETRSLKAVEHVAREVFQRNIDVWSAIKKPTPEAFFENLQPMAADGHIRQALVLCYMMLPRGKKSLADVRQIVTDIFERNIAAWQADEKTLTTGLVRSRKPAKAKPAKAKPAKTRPKPARKKKAAARA